MRRRSNEHESRATQPHGRKTRASLVNYAKAHPEECRGLNISEFDFAPFQPDKQSAVKGVPTRQYSHSNDRVAGNDPIEGATQEDTSKDSQQDHNIFSFWNQIQNLPTGNYKVVDRKIVPDN